MREQRSADDDDVDVPGTGFVGMGWDDLDVWSGAGGREGGGDVEKFHVDGLGHDVRRDGEGGAGFFEHGAGAVAEKVDAGYVCELDFFEEDGDAVGGHGWRWGLRLWGLVDE